MINHLKDIFLYLNSSLAMENGALERVQRRRSRTYENPDIEDYYLRQEELVIRQLNGLLLSGIYEKLFCILYESFFLLSLLAIRSN
jgi:hypothetical protein